jgi:hypothetical protein
VLVAPTQSAAIRSAHGQAGPRRIQQRPAGQSAFTTENCSATFGNLWDNQREIYLRGIANTFAELGRRFRSHDGFKIGARLILDRPISDYGSWSSYQRRDTLRDVERVFRELDGQGACPEAQSIVSLVTSAHRDRALPYVSRAIISGSASSIAAISISG